MNTNKSLYEVLGVNKTDSCSDIKKAFLKLAKQHHPDKGGDQEKFKEIQRASEVLTDDKKRKLYDDFGVIGDENGGGPQVNNNMPFGMGGGFPFPFEVNINDFFGNMFGGNQQPGQKGPIRKGKKPPPVSQTYNVSLEQFYLGHSVDININRQSFCKDCDHSGATRKETCNGCNGRGIISQIQHIGPMVMHTNGPCHKCQGQGEIVLEKCDKCSGTGFGNESRNLNIKITPGIRPGEIFTFSEVCSDNPQFERPGDVHIIIQEDPNDVTYKTFKRCGDKLQDLETLITLSLSESLMGCTVRIDGHPGYDEGLFCKIPAGSFKGDKYCINGLGMPVLGDIGKHGNLYINIDVSIRPVERLLFSNQGRDLLSGLFGDKVREITEKPSDDSVFSEMYLIV
jgi:DnaJ family protein A protein 2